MWFLPNVDTYTWFVLLHFTSLFRFDYILNFSGYIGKGVGPYPVAPMSLWKPFGARGISWSGE